MGLYANIYDSASGRDPLSVWSADVQRVLVVNAEGPFERRSPDEPAVRLELAAGGRGVVKAVPVGPNNQPPRGVWFMKGYSYIASSDSRFSEAVEKISGHPFYGAVPLHDRVEG